VSATFVECRQTTFHLNHVVAHGTIEIVKLQRK